MSRRLSPVERHRESVLASEEAATCDESQPAAPITTRRLDIARTCYNGFLRWLNTAEKVEGGADLTVTVHGIELNRMGTAEARALRLWAWKLCVWNLDYFEAKCRPYVVIPEAEATRARGVRYRLDEFENA